MADYYSLLARAVSRLGNNTPEARQAMYEHARRALNDLIVSSELEPAHERRSLELAILQIEYDASARQGTAEFPQRGGHPMRVFLLACIIAVFLAIVGYYGLSSIQEPVSRAFSTDAVRLD